MLLDETPVGRREFPVFLWPRSTVLVDHPWPVLGAGDLLGNGVHLGEERVVMDHLVALGVVVAEVLGPVDTNPIGTEIHLAALEFEQNRPNGWLLIVEM